MAQLGNVLRITLTGARVEKAAGFFPWQKKAQDADVWPDWRAETRRREGADWVEEIGAEGQITGAEIRWWAGWFANAARVKGFPNKLGDNPAEPVARLWTPLAGQAVEFFVWPEPTGQFVLMALLTPNADHPHVRAAVETTLPAETLAAFGATLESEYETLKANAK